MNKITNLPDLRFLKPDVSEFYDLIKEDRAISKMILKDWIKKSKSLVKKLEEMQRDFDLLEKGKQGK